MINRKTLISGLLLFGASAAAGRPDSHDEKQLVSASSSDHPLSLREASLNPAAVPRFPSIASCFAVTSSVIKQFCEGSQASPANIKKLSTAIMDIKQIDPMIAEYIDIVFNYLPGFKIRLISRAELEKEVLSISDSTKAMGAYYVQERILHLAYREEMNDYDRSLIVHEFRHALMHALQLVRSQVATVSTECYFPLVDAERGKVIRYIEEGDTNVQKLHELLKRETRNQLNKKEKEYLAHLRSLVNEHVRHYFQDVDIRINPPGFVHYFEGKLGKVIPSLPQYADISPSLKVMNHQKIDENTYLVTCRIVDPLWSMVRAHTKAIARVKKDYPGENYLFERDAHLLQRIFPPFLKALYPDYYQYTRDLVASTVFPERVHSSAMSKYGFAYSYDLAADMLLTCATRFQATQADQMLRIIQYNIGHKIKLDQSQKGAEILIDKSVHVAEANLCLGDIAFVREDYPTAYKHYKRFAKYKQAFRGDQLLNYAESAQASGKHKAAEKICRKALRVPAAQLGWTKAKFEKILSDIQTKKHAVHRVRP